MGIICKLREIRPSKWNQCELDWSSERNHVLYTLSRYEERLQACFWEQFVCTKCLNDRQLANPRLLKWRAVKIFL